MITKAHTAKAATSIAVSPDKVWKALIDPQLIKQYFFGTTVESDWKEGSTITWKGEWEGNQYEDKGKILRMEDQKVLQYSHFSPMSGAKDVPENYHIVTIEILKKDKHTHLVLTQTNNADEKAKEHAEKNWNMMLTSLKKKLEQTN